MERKVLFHMQIVEIWIVLWQRRWSPAGRHNSETDRSVLVPDDCLLHLTRPLQVVLWLVVQQIEACRISMQNKLQSLGWESSAHQIAVQTQYRAQHLTAANQL